VKRISFLNPPPLYIEIAQVRLKAFYENDGVELPLERLPGGRLTSSCKEKTVAALKKFLKVKSWQPRARAFCAVDSRGVSLRHLSLPAGTNEEFHRRLLLQIEGEFPLPPDELAWGSQSLGVPQSSKGTVAKRELLVAAMKKEVVADYYEILRACGTNPVFTLAASARSNLCVQPADAFAMLDIGNSQSEVTGFEKDVPANSRIIFCGSENISGPADAKFNTLVHAIKGCSSGLKLFISGNRLSEEHAALLATSLGDNWQLERLEAAGGTGSSLAISGLQKFVEQGGEPPLLIYFKHANRTSTNLATLNLQKWGPRVGLLLAALLLLPYAEALLLKPHLEKKVALFKAEAVRLTIIDHELDFLRYLKQSQPPYLDALYIFSKSVPPGARFDALSLNSHGEVSLRGSFRDGQQVADFRSKIIASGFFANVTIEEQVPTPDRQRVNVRITAQEKPAPQLLSLSVGPTADEIGKDGKQSSLGMMPPIVNSVAPTAPSAEKKVIQ
jgi:hypothetical protein